MDVPLLTPEGKVYRPLPTQLAAHRSAARNRLYQGGYGSGKTLWGAVEALLVSLSLPDGKGATGLIGRYDYRELIDTTWKTFLEIIPPAVKRQCRITQRPPSLIFPNGYLVLGYNLKKHQQLGSLNLSWAWIDEVNEDGVEESVYLQLQGRLRNKKGPRSLWLSGNPGGHNWVWRRFLACQEDPSAKRYPDHDGFKAGTTENVYLPDDYLQRMRNTYPQDWLDRYFSGDTSVFEGQILDSFDPDIHVVNPFPLPGVWPRYRGLDHGITHPSVCTWCSTDFHENLLWYRELYRRGATPEEMVADIDRASRGEESEWTVIDPATKQKQTAAGQIERIIDQYRRAGLICQEADNKMTDSIVRIKSLLRRDPERKFPYWHHYADTYGPDEKGAPRFYITTACPTLRWELENWKWKDVKPGSIDREKPLAVNDDGIATVRYILMRRPQSASPIALQSAGDRIREIIADLAVPGVGEEAFIGSERLR